MRRNLTFFLLSFVAIIVIAQTESTYTLRFRANNGMTSEQLPATFYIMKEDSTVVDSIITPRWKYWTNGEEHAYFGNAENNLKLIPGTEMLLKATCEGFESETMPLKVPGGKLRAIENLDIKLYPLPSAVELDEVVVKHSRVKMVLKGDTIVFDAAKFQLAHGDMLSQMVKQMDGLTIEEGVIYMNGRKVDDLLVNGESFFKGDPSVALNNLPAFTVKNIKFYDKLPDSAYLTGEEVGVEKDYVLDVTLKKEYVTGYLGNLEGGYGTSDRYIGRGFGIGFGQKFRLGAFFNINNIQNVQTATASSSGDWDSHGTGAYSNGNADRRLAGIDYIYSPSKSFKMKGEVNMQSNSQFIQEINSNTNFYETGNTFTRSVSDTHRREFRLSTYHNFQLTTKYVYAELKPQIDYNHFNSELLRRTGLFSVDINETYRGETIDSIFSPSASRKWTDGLMYKVRDKQRNRQDGLSARVDFMSKIKFSEDASDYLTLAAFVKHSYTNSDTRQQYALTYQNLPENDNDFDRLTKSKPRYTETEACLAYDWRTAPNSHDVIFTLRPYASVNYLNNDRDNRLYLLDGLPIETDGVKIEINDAIQAAIDRQNSYWSNQKTTTGKVRMEFGLAKSVKLFTASIQGAMNFKHSTLGYNKPEFYEHLTKNFTLPEAHLMISHTKRTDKFNHYLRFNTSYTTQAPELSSFVDTWDTTDPLNIYAPAKYLKNPGNIESRISYSLYINKLKASFYCYANYNEYINKEVLNRLYDATTGITTWTPSSMNGSRYFSGSGRFNFNIYKGLRGGVGESYYFNRSVAMLSDGDFNGKTIVNYTRNMPNIGLSWDQTDLNVYCTFAYSFNKSHSSRKDYGQYSSNVAYITASVEYKLPWNMKILTDFDANLPHGSTTEAMNQPSLQWGFRVSQPFAKDRWIVTLAASDILNKNNWVSRYANTDRATETWYSHLPRYVMLTVAYKFNYNPHK